MTRTTWAALVTTLVALLTASTAAAQSTLLTGQTLASGQALTSPDGRYELATQTDGNLALYTRAASFWSSQTTQHDLQPGGELLLGESLYAAGRHYELTMASGGRLSLRDSAGTLWRSGNPRPRRARVHGGPRRAGGRHRRGSCRLERAGQWPRGRIVCAPVPQRRHGDRRALGQDHMKGEHRRDAPRTGVGRRTPDVRRLPVPHAGAARDVLRRLAPPKATGAPATRTAVPTGRSNRDRGLAAPSPHIAREMMIRSGHQPRARPLS